ncbi:MAG: hypothetical protein AAB499_02990, partial [Patescibacteria group bacterium]
MAKRHLAKRTIKYLVLFLGLSVVIIALVSSYYGTRGRQIKFSTRPSQPYQEVSFPSLAHDRVTLEGWYFPVEAPGPEAKASETAVIVHGWSGHRGRWLDL